MPDSPGRNAGLSRKKCRTLQEKIPDSPGRNAGLSRKKFRTLQEKIPDSPGRNAGLSRKFVLEFSCKHRVLRTTFVCPCFVYCYIVVN
jgi:hypothetical protein